MELLNEAMVINGFQEPHKTPSDEYYDFKKKLDEFYGELKKFMETKKLNDSFMIKLLEYLYCIEFSALLFDLLLMPPAGISGKLYPRYV